MKAGVLFSGGKDSALTALMLSRDYAVELNTYVFRERREIPAVKKAAELLGLPHRIRKFPPGMLEKAAGMIIQHGFPNEAITWVHETAVRDLCRDYRVVADGTRLNDRVPVLGLDRVQQLYDSCGCSYVRPLFGYGKPEVERLAARAFVIRHGETGKIENGDYEAEIRAAVSEQGADPKALFPPHHDQSLVIGRV